MPLTELPLGLPGRLFGSPMPFGSSDPEGQLVGEYRRQNVSAIVLLASDEECLRQAQRDLRSVYRQDGFAVVYLPIRDFDVPPRAALDAALAEALEHLRAGRHVAVHCSAGIGRTGTFAACLARQALRLSGNEAIVWIRRHIPGAVETPAQKEVVRAQEG